MKRTDIINRILLYILLKPNKRAANKNNFHSFILLSLISLIISLGVLETVLRLTHLFGARISYIQPDRVLGMRFIPEHSYWSCKENNIPISGKINSLGWRSKERSLKKSANTFRIAVLGDSYVEAMQVEIDRTFLVLAENEINEETSKKFELWNFGLSGFTQTEEFLILQNELKKYAVDMVILFFFPGNDIDDIARKTAYYKNSRPFFTISKNQELILDTSFSTTLEFKVKCFMNIFKKHSALISLIAERYNVFRQMRSEQRNKIETKITGYLSLFTSHPDRIYLENYKLNKRLIQAMAEYCRGEKIKFMLVCCDVYFNPRIEQEYKKIDSTFDKYFFEDDLQHFSQSVKIEYLGLQRIFSNASTLTGLTYHWSPGGHWDYQGHGLVATALHSKLKPLF